MSLGPPKNMTGLWPTLQHYYSSQNTETTQMFTNSVCVCVCVYSHSRKQYSKYSKQISMTYKSMNEYHPYNFKKKESTLYHTISIMHKNYIYTLFKVWLAVSLLVGAVSTKRRRGALGVRQYSIS